MMKIRKIILPVLSLFLAIGLLASPLSAGVNTPYNWYCKNNDSHTPPALDEGMRFIEKYSAYYLDRGAKAEDPVIYLTFDAGYENGNVEKILDVLDAHGVKGCFFILENLIKRAPDLVKRMAEGGHAVCNHTRNHPDMSAITDKELFAAQLTSLEEAYTALTGKEMLKVYRPPQGRFSEQNLAYAKEMGYKTLFWSFAYADWDNNKQPNPEKALEKVLAHLHNGEVMLLHPTSATNAAIMERLLCEIERQGYRIAPIEELFR